MVATSLIAQPRKCPHDRDRRRRRASSVLRLEYRRDSRGGRRVITPLDLSRPKTPASGTVGFKGRDEVRRHIEERVEVLGDFEITVERVLETGRDRVLVIFEFRGAGGRSGAPYAMRIAQHLSVEGSRVAEVQDYLDPDRALSELT